MSETIRRDTGRAKLPALPPLNAADPKSVANWAQRVAERLEVREGARGNPAERAVTLRELEAVQGTLNAMTKVVDAPPGSIPIKLGGGLSATVAIEQFIEAIRGTRLYRDLVQRIDDPARFNSLVAPVREVVLRSIAHEAMSRGAEIRKVETRLQNSEQSLAMAVSELTAALGAQSAGLRQTQFAYADADRAQAGQITQIESSLGNYYLDGTPGRANLEEAMTTSASRIDGLRVQYTLKVQAGGAIAGYGVAAEEVDGVPSSAFIIAANKFAIVAPTYSGGLTNSPDASIVPFGVDANGIYMNTSVYIKGTTKIDTGGKTIAQGLRGSVDALYTAAAWSDSSASQAVWTALGKAGSPVNTLHLLVGDTVTRTNGATPPVVETRYWNDTAWVAQGVFINGNLLVNGSIASTKIDTRNLDIKDASGAVIFSSGVNLASSRVSGLGSLATQSYADWSQLTSVPSFGNFAYLSSITAANISTYIAGAAIGTAYIANGAITTLKVGDAQISTAKIADLAVNSAKIADLAVSTLKIAGQAVTVPVSNSTSGTSVSVNVAMPEGGSILGLAIVQNFKVAGFSDGVTVNVAGSTSVSNANAFGGSGGVEMVISLVAVKIVSVGAGTHTVTATSTNTTSHGGGSPTLTIVALGVKK